MSFLFFLREEAAIMVSINQQTQPDWVLWAGQENNRWNLRLKDTHFCFEDIQYKGTIFSALLLIDHGGSDSSSYSRYLFFIINWRRLGSTCMCVRARVSCLLAGVSTHAGRAWQVHYFDCRLTICLYDRRPWSLAIDGRETHWSITQRPPAALKSSPAHRWTCWVLLDRIGYWLRRS